MIGWTQVRNYWRHSFTLSMNATLSIATLVIGVLEMVFPRPISHQKLIHTNAKFISLKNVTEMFTTMQVTVRFVTMAPTRTIVANIYPRDQTHFVNRALIPIDYLAGQPSHAYFAGPGGDVNSLGWTPNLGLLLLLFGAALIIQQLNWGRRMFSLAKSASDQGPTIRVHWHHNSYAPILVATTRAVPWQLSWRAVVIDSQIDLISPRRLKSAWARRNRLMPSTVQAGTDLNVGQRVVARSGDLIFLPLSAAAPTTLSRRVSEHVSPGDNLMSRHRQLLSAYADVLNCIRQLPALFGASGKRYSARHASRFKSLRCWRFVVRVHTEAHIRRQLRNLSKVYVRRHFTSAHTLNSDNGKQFLQLREECDTFLESLSNNSRLISALVAAFTIAAPIIPLLIKTNPSSLYAVVKSLVYYAALTIIFLPGTIAVFVYADAFRFKRQLFGADLPSMKSRTYQSVYEMEDHLYKLLDQPKISERASDLWIRASAIGVLYIFFLNFTFGPHHQLLSIFDWILTAAIVGIPTWYLARSLWYRRLAEK